MLDLRPAQIPRHHVWKDECRRSYACVGAVLHDHHRLLDLDSDVVETDTNLQFDNANIEPVGNDATLSFSTAIPGKISKNKVLVTNSDFEQTNVSTNATTVAKITDTTMIPNWLPGGVGAQVIQSAGYMMFPFVSNSLFYIHLNNPESTANGTQELIVTTLATNPKAEKSYTVQYDCARMPKGPINLLSALKVSSITNTTTNAWKLQKIRYNVTDTPSQITWTRQSFVYVETSSSTKLQFKSMSETYGPMIDNIVVLPGKHELAVAPPGALWSPWQRMNPIVIAFVATAFHYPQLSSFL